jgi:hypothetical protein
VGNTSAGLSSVSSASARRDLFPRSFGYIQLPHMGEGLKRI